MSGLPFIFDCYLPNPGEIWPIRYEVAVTSGFLDSVSSIGTAS